MQFGTALPGRDFQDPVMIRDYVQALEGAGFDFVSSAEHVIGGHPDRVPEGERVHTIDVPYQDPFVLFSFIAGCTERLGMVSSILILPQRQTVLVAKQAADLDRLTGGGRLRLGIGLGRNWMEYEALNENFRNRGRRVEEQIEVLRRLWSEELVTFEGQWHQLDRMGLNPGSIQRPIPIWMGTYVQVVENAIKRVGRLADGWFPQFAPDDPDFLATLERMRGYAREAGRDPSEIGIDASLRGEDPDDMVRQAELWRDLGATHLRVGGPQSVPGSVQERINTLTTAREALSRAGF